MSNVEEFRKVQIELRLVTQKLGHLAAEEKAHPDRTAPGDSGDVYAKWLTVKGEFNKRRAVLKSWLRELEVKRDELYQSTNQTPLSRASMAEILDALTGIEARFTVDGMSEAWDALTAFIDWLERENNRVNVEEQIALLERVPA